MSAGATAASLLDAAPAAATAVRRPEGDLLYGELRELVGAAAQALAATGTGHGDRVLIRCGEDFGRLVAILASHSVGAVAAALNPATTGAELEFLASHSDPQALVADEHLAGLDLAPEVAILINEAGVLRARRDRDGASEPRAPQPGDAASLLYTSGSSARPRGALLSHAAHVAMGADLAVLLGVGRDDRFLALSPFFHVGGWSTAVMPALAAGASLVLPGPFSAGRFWADAERWRPSVWTTGLAFLEMVAARGGAAPAHPPFRHVISNLRPDTWKLAREVLGLPIGTYYGLTENDGRGTFALAVDDYEPGFVGRVYTERDGLRLTKDGTEVAPGEVGEIEFRGPSTMSEYFRDPEATAKTLSDGWVKTGDLGRLGEDGDLYFSGRLKNMIKRSGENVSAEEVELFLLAHPEVEDVAVTAVADRVREEEIKAIVVRAAGSEASAEALHAFCREGMASFKVPRYFQFVAELPHTISGKPDIAAVRRNFASPEGSWDSLTQEQPS
ncbi:MAG: class I adenylate-forming enzyme family protein [Solirubrobacterales bacterium]